MDRSSYQKRRRKSTLSSLPPLLLHESSLSFDAEDDVLIKPPRKSNHDSSSSSSSRTRPSRFFTVEKAKKLRTTFAPNRIIQKINARKQKLVEDLDNNNVIQEVAQTYGLSPRQLRKLRRKFKQIDLDESGSIECSELFLALEEEQTAVTDAFFKLMDTDGTGHIELEEFILVCSTYCVYSRKDILKFCFDCFDTDASGFIDENEYRNMCKSVNNGFPSFPGNFSNALEMFDRNGDGVIDIKEFIELDRRFPMLMFPAFRLQEKMQQLTLGEHQWTKINENIERSRHQQQQVLKTNVHIEPNKGILEKKILPRLKINMPEKQHIIIPEDVDKMKRIY